MTLEAVTPHHLQTAPPLEIRPQPGPQEMFVASSADIAFYGGAAGGGKSYALLIDPLRHKDNPLFRAAIFRRDTPMLLNPGGLWDESQQIYPLFGAVSSRLTWYFPSGARFQFAHMHEEKDKLGWQGAQIPYIGFDEVTHFSRDQFFFMLSRLRSLSGVPGHVRATCNPDPDSWVAEMIAWWINQSTGEPIAERSGKLRWFIRRGEEFIWGDTRQALVDRFGTGADVQPKSVTFIPARVHDNKILLGKDPAYLSNLYALNTVDRGRLLHGNWKIKARSGEVFRREWFKRYQEPPMDAHFKAFFIDCAAEPGISNDYTAIGIWLRSSSGFFCTRVWRKRVAFPELEAVVKDLASAESPNAIVIERASAGIQLIQNLRAKTTLPVISFETRGRPKLVRALGAQPTVEAGNCYLPESAPWVESFLDELENFPDSAHDDQVDTLSMAVEYLKQGNAKPGVFLL